MKREISLAHVSGKWAFDDTQDVDEDVVEVMEKNGVCSRVEKAGMTDTEA